MRMEDITILYRDIFDLILLKYLNQRSMVTAKRVCKRWYNIIRQQVRNKMPPDISPFYMLKHAMHIYLENCKNMQNVPLNDNIDTHWWTLHACKSGDADLVFRWLKRCIITPFYASWGLYYCGKPEWLKLLNVAEDVEGAVMGSAEGGRDILFYQKCIEGLGTGTHFNERIEGALRLATRKKRVNVIKKSKSIFGLVMLFKCCLTTALEMRNDELVKEIIEVLDVSIPDAIVGMANVPGIIPDLTLKRIECLDYLIRIKDLVTVKDLQHAYCFSMREGRKEIVEKRIKELLN